MWAPSAFAADTAEASAAAQVLFDQGKALMKGGKFAEACPKLEESQRLDPRIGTQFNLADCYEHLGRTASAWTNFVDVVASTKAAVQIDREKVAQERASTLERKLSRVTVRVEGKDVAGLRVTRDGIEIGRPLWDTPVPIDPGEHRLEASAPGKIAWKSSFTVGARASTATVTVPALADDPTALKAAKGAASDPTAMPGPGRLDQGESGAGTGQRVAGGVLGAVGVAGIVVGSIFGLGAQSKLEDSKPYCRTADLCMSPGLDLVHQAKTSATISTVGFAAGGAFLAGGVLVFLTAPSHTARPASARFLPLLGPGVAGGSLQGHF